jgi:NitT/TauT family transport system permease protein
MSGVDRTKGWLSPGWEKWGLRLLSVCVFTAVWEVVALRLRSLMLPTFSATLVALVRLLGSPDLWEALWISNQAMALGFSLAAVLGTASGALMGRWRAAETFIDPYLSILLVMPKSAIIPILIMATGLGVVTRVLIVFSFAFVIITVNTRAGLRTVDPGLIEMARSFGAREGQLWRKIVLPGALPAILTGLRLGLAQSITGMLLVELLILALGIGRLMLDFQGTFDSASLYATVLVVVSEAVVLMQLFKELERRAASWTESPVVE